MTSKYTKEYFFNRILGRIDVRYDIRPETPLYLATGPAAEEFALTWDRMDYTVEQIFPLTQDRAHLIRDAKTYGIAPYPESAAIAEGEFNKKLEPGERFSKDEVNFYIGNELATRESEDYFYYELICEELGDVGNVAPGDLIPIRTITGLSHAKITKILIPGEQEEETEDFRARYLDSFIHKPYCGNGADYMKEMGEYEGVGRSKILRCRNPEWEIDPEWVGVVFIDSEFNRPSQEFINRVQEYFHPLSSLGLPDIETSGIGLSGIGQLVHVHGAEEEPINIEVNFTFEMGCNWNNMISTIEERIEEFLLELRKTWGEVLYVGKAKYPIEDQTEVNRVKLMSALMDIPGILDVADLKINGEYENYKCSWIGIPVLGEITENAEKEFPECDCPYNCPDCSCNRSTNLCSRYKE